MNCKAYVAFIESGSVRIIFIDALTRKEAEQRAVKEYGIPRETIISSGYTGVDDGFVTHPICKI